MQGRIADQRAHVNRRCENFQRDLRYDSDSDDDFPRRGNFRAAPVKVELPIFRGDLDVEEFLDWIAEIEQYFDVLSIPEDLQVKHVVCKLRNGALTWWQQHQNNRRLDGRGPIRRWTSMKRALKERFLPKDYEQVLYLKLQECRQGDGTVQQYAREFYRLTDRNNVMETEGQQTARFIKGLRYAIRDQVELHINSSVDEVVSRAEKIEAQLARKRFQNKFKCSNESGIQEEKVVEKATAVEKGKATLPDTHAQQQKVANPYAKQYGTRCYRCNEEGHLSNKCPRRQVNLAENIGEDKEETVQNIYISPDDVYNTDEDEETRRTCVVRKLSLSAVKVAECPLRNSLFETKCKVADQVLDVIIDGGSQSNLISRQLVKKLKLPTRRHANPYSMGWIRSANDLKVTEQCDIDFAIGKYHDKGTFDVVDMDVCQLVFGRPWQFDVDAGHNGRTNTYEFTKDKVKYVLCPSSSRGDGSVPKKPVVSLCIFRPLFGATHQQTYTRRQVKKIAGASCLKNLDSRSSPFQGRANDAGVNRKRA